MLVYATGRLCADSKLGRNDPQEGQSDDCLCHHLQCTRPKTMKEKNTKTLFPRLGPDWAQNHRPGLTAAPSSRFPLTAVTTVPSLLRRPNLGCRSRHLTCLHITAVAVTSTKIAASPLHPLAPPLALDPPPWHHRFRRTASRPPSP